MPMIETGVYCNGADLTQSIDNLEEFQTTVFGYPAKVDLINMTITVSFKDKEVTHKVLAIEDSHISWESFKL